MIFGSLPDTVAKQLVGASMDFFGNEKWASLEGILFFLFLFLRVITTFYNTFPSWNCLFFLIFCFEKVPRQAFVASMPETRPCSSSLRLFLKDFKKIHMAVGQKYWVPKKAYW